MTDKQFLGEFEQMVLLAILRLGETAYAVPIRDEIAGRASRDVARGALYTTLERLEAKGFLASRMSDPTPERGGRSRRYFEVTGEGMHSLRHSHAARRSGVRGLSPAVWSDRGPRHR